MLIEERVRKYLAARLGEDVWLEYPEAPGETFAVIARTGGRGGHIREAMFAVQSYAPTLAAAAALNECVKAAMDEFVWEENISACRLNSDYEFTDTTKKRYRYQAVYEIYYMED